MWRQGSGRFGFRIRLTHLEYTRVGLVSKVEGLFNPLGAAALMTIKASIRERARPS